jgi:hypothetical protein
MVPNSILDCKGCEEPCINNGCPVERTGDWALECVFCEYYQSFACRECILNPEIIPAQETRVLTP